MYAVFFIATTSGYRYRIAGADGAFARYGGIEASHYWTPAMAISGGFFGLTGYFAMAGTYGVCHIRFSGGIGWSAIAVALVALKLSGKNYVLEVPALIFSAVLFAALQEGSEIIVMHTSVKIESTSLIQALVLVFATVNIYRRRKQKRLLEGGENTFGECGEAPDVS
jgi:simple sugar transport system permease protein